jgi:hypothetical protein
MSFVINALSTVQKSDKTILAAFTAEMSTIILQSSH